MALLETKVLQVENDQNTITNTSNIMGSFGWTVLSVQVTHSQNTKTYSSALDQWAGNRTQTVKTTTINYATMTLQRDKHMPNYAEVVRLEEEYNQLEGQVSQNVATTEKKSIAGTIILVLIAVFGSFFVWLIEAGLQSVLGATGMNTLEWVLIGILLIILGYSIIRAILDGVSYLSKRFLNKPLTGLDQFLAKMPRSVWSYLYGKPAADKKPKKKSAAEQRREEVEAFNEQALRRMSEIREQAESLIA